MTKKRLIFGILIIFLVTALGAGQGFDSVFGAAEAEDSTSPVTLQGKVGIEFGYYMDEEWESDVEARPSADLTVLASNETAEAVLSINLDASALEPTDFIENLLDELYVKIFFPIGHLTAGLYKLEWGNGDGIHAIDPLNPIDQSAGPTTDYLASKRSEAMVALSIYLGGNGLAEIIYKPFFHPIKTAWTGRWAVVDASTIPGFSNIEAIEVDTLEYSQAAARVSGSFGPIDLGMLYYYGYMPEPGFRYLTTFTGTNPMDPTHYSVSTELVYTRAQLIGLETAAALGPFTLRAEAGYWLSEDVDGTAPELYNSRIVYLGGVDAMIPGTNWFASVQALGAYTMNADDLTAADVDRMLLYDGGVTSHSIIGSIEIPFLRETMKIRLGGVYSVEAMGYVFIPEYTWTISDGAEIGVGGKIFGGKELENSPYYAWNNNNSVNVALRYRF